MVYISGFVDEPWQETYLIATNKDGRPATVRFEIRYYGAKGNGRDHVVTGKSELTPVELADLRMAFAKLEICSTPAEGDVVFDAPSVFFEFADEEHYCFSSRIIAHGAYPEFYELSKLIGEFSGKK